jgi:hypothetical protein
MMSWSNWIYLVIGIGLGVGSRWLFDKSEDRRQELEGLGGLRDDAELLISNSQFPNHLAPATNQATSTDVALAEKLKQTEIAYQLAQQMSQFKAGFLVRTSHELRSPLNSLIGLHQIILSDLCDDPAEERTFVAQANSSALKLIDLLDQILEVSRLEHGNSKLEIQPLQLAVVLAEVYNSIHLIAANRNIRLHLSPPESEIYLLADPRWLRQVLLNILDTCLTYMEQGSISISTSFSSASNYAQILLDVNLAPTIWSEPVDLSQTTQSKSVLKNTAPSFGMTLLLTQTILELMQSRLEIVPLPITVDADSQTRVQLTIPLMIPESETASVLPEGN